MGENCYKLNVDVFFLFSGENVFAYRALDLQAHMRRVSSQIPFKKPKLVRMGVHYIGSSGMTSPGHGPIDLYMVLYSSIEILTSDVVSAGD